jgi:hypothetical protein
MNAGAEDDDSDQSRHTPPKLKGAGTLWLAQRGKAEQCLIYVPCAPSVGGVSSASRGACRGKARRALNTPPCFFELTRGHVIVLGPRTYRSVPAFAHNDRTVVAIRSTEQPADVIARRQSSFPYEIGHR